MPSELLRQGVLTLLAALVASWVFLLYRYHDGGRPFGSRRSGGWALLVIVVMALVATALGLGLPQAATVVPPIWVGLIAPAMLGVRRLEKQERPPEGHELLFGVITIGLKLLLDRLEWRMSLDREDWCAVRLGEHWTMEQLDDAGLDLYTILCKRVSDLDRQQGLRSDYDALSQAVLNAEKATEAREYRRARHAAEQAFLSMLAQAYDWGYTDVKPSPLGRSRPDLRGVPKSSSETHGEPRKPRRRLDPT